MESERKKMTLYEFLKPFTERSHNENISLHLAGGKVYDGQMRDIPALYILRPYTIKTAELDWDELGLVIVLNVPKEGET